MSKVMGNNMMVSYIVFIIATAATDIIIFIAKKKEKHFTIYLIDFSLDNTMQWLNNFN